MVVMIHSVDHGLAVEKVQPNLRFGKGKGKEETRRKIRKSEREKGMMGKKEEKLKRIKENKKNDNVEL